jgi:anti-sigma factor ChrR (cupin superfamily)
VNVDRLLITSLFAGPLMPERFKWEPFRPGVEISRIYGGESGASSAALLRYAAGASVPRHVHGGHEHIIVLQGSQRDEHGSYPTGSMLVHRPGTNHRVESPEGCIVLAIWERPVEIEGE